MQGNIECATSTKEYEAHNNMISSWFYCRLSALVIKFNQTNIVHKESKYHSQLRLIQFPLWFLCPLTSSSLACPFLYQLRQDPVRFVLSGTQHIRERRPRWEQLRSDTWDRGGLLATWRRAAQEQGGGERGLFLLFLHFLLPLSRASQSPLFCALFPPWSSPSRSWMSIQ